MTNDEIIGVIDRYLPNVWIEQDEDGCWEWTYRCSSSSDEDKAFDDPVQALADFAKTLIKDLDALEERYGMDADDE